MYMTLLALVVVLALTYLWVTRGFMSSLIHMVCVLVAGAIAFGVWEPVSLFLLNISPDRGFGSQLSGLAWGLGLALPFAAALALLRVSVDSILPANAQCDSIADYIGGGVCGFISAVISAGILVMSIGFLRLEPTVLGHTTLEYTSQASRGSVERPQTKLVPWVDKLTASVYSHLSMTTLRTNRPMGIWHPDFDTFPASLRMTYDGKSRNTLKPEDFSVLSWYNVGDPQRPGSMRDLLVDYWNETPQRISGIDGEPISQGHLTGLVVQFRAGARERGGYIAVGNGQMRLVVRREGGETARAIHPIAVITRTANPTHIEYARFRFDSDDFFVASVGGESDALMAFEFPVPAGYRPIAMYVKGVRYPLANKRATLNFETVEERDQMIRDGEFEGMQDIGPILGPDGRPIEIPHQGEIWIPDPVVVGTSLGFVIQKGTERGLNVERAGRSWAISEGEGIYSHTEIARAWGTEFSLQISSFAVTQDTAMVRVNVTPAYRDADFVRNYENADRNAPVELVDTNGRRYQAVGFLFDDGTNHHIRYTRGQPIRTLGELPAVSRNNPDRKLTILFTVSRGVDIAEFQIGRGTIERYNPPISADAFR